MDPFRSHRGSQKGIFLAGCILSCFLQLVPAQQRLTVIPVPQNPKVDQNVLLNLRGAPDPFLDCEWTQPSGRKITFSPQEDSKSKTSKDDTEQRITVHQNCSLEIRNLRLSAEGNYTVTITTNPSKKQDSQDQTNKESYKGSIFLNISEVNEIIVKPKPPFPHPGQNVTLIPEGFPRPILQCQWSRTIKSGEEQEIQNSKSEPRKHQNQQQKTIQQDCSLHITHLTTDDSGNYTVYIGASSDQNSKPGKGTEEEPKFYRGQVVLQVIRQSEQIPHSGSASLKFSTGIIAGALLGTLTWTSAFSSLLFSMFS